MALLVQPPPPRLSEENESDAEAVHLTVRAESGSDIEHDDIVATHSDPHDPWHQVSTYN